MVVRNIFFAASLFAASLLAQTASFPLRVPTDMDLLMPRDRAETKLTTGMTASTLMLTVESGSRFGASMIVTVDAEQMLLCQVSGNTLLVCSGGRGFAGTVAASHSSNAAVRGQIGAWYYNRLKTEMQAIASKLLEGSYATGLALKTGDKGALVWTSEREKNATLFDFTRTSGFDASATLTSPGVNTITLTNCPSGVAGVPNSGYVYISGGAGTPEAVAITGGTCTSGAAGGGTITVTTANSHSGAWTVRSASAGIQEALNSCGAPCAAYVPDGEYTLYGPVLVPQLTTDTAHRYSLRGAGRATTRLNVAASFPLTAAGVIIAQNDAANKDGGPAIEDIAILCQQPWASPRTSYTQWPPIVWSKNYTGTAVRRARIVGAWTGIKIQGSGQHVIDDVQISAYYRGVDLQGTYDVNRIHALHFWPYTDSNAATFTDQTPLFDPNVVGLYAAANDGITISDSFFINGTALDLASGNSIVTISNTSFDGFGAIRVGTGGGGSMVTVSGSFFYQNGIVGTYNCSQPAVTLGSSGVSFALTNSWFTKSCATQPTVRIDALGGYNPAFAQISFTGNTFIDATSSTTTQPIFQIDGTGGLQNVNISNNHISYADNLAYTNPMLRLTGSNVNLTFAGNQNDGQGSGTWLSVANDGNHVITGNLISRTAGAWTVSLPSTKTQGIYQDTSFQYAAPDPVVNLTGPTVHGIALRNASYACNATGGQVQVNLPFASLSKGFRYRLIKTDASANACVFVPAGPDTINGVNASKSTATQYGTLTLTSDGAAWWLF